MNRAPVLRSARLAQSSVPLRIAVVDASGRPEPGAEVTVRVPGAQQSGFTDRDGVAVVGLPGPLAGASEVDVLVRAGAYSAVQKATVDDAWRGTVFVKLPVCLPQAFLTTTELLALAGAAGLAYAGHRWKKGVLVVTGEILLGAAIFSAINRHSC